ncbi:hypothetical protein BCR34DRAFT_572670 [Clohesyomyces aquaticus]|uniref:Uncharacterized protein n=1 Tax=Clohesyomyces aquaticus TaxID=1231657 RepID=A0A1Y1Z2D6_9PLEO|nr:hypothetical protein BCR34DRAFT_572670 [Clohesyomyces aquaticus]
MAWCIHTKCADFNYPESWLEAFWESQITGDANVAPKSTYAEACLRVTKPPKMQLLGTVTDLNTTALVPEMSWKMQYNVLEAL